MSLQKVPQSASANLVAHADYKKTANQIDLAYQLSSMRNQAGLTQEEVASRMKTHKSNISRLERGGSSPNWQTLVKYAQACGFDLAIIPLKH